MNWKLVSFLIGLVLGAVLMYFVSYFGKAYGLFWTQTRNPNRQRYMRNMWTWEFASGWNFRGNNSGYNLSGNAVQQNSPIPNSNNQ